MWDRKHRSICGGDRLASSLDSDYLPENLQSSDFQAKQCKIIALMSQGIQREEECYQGRKTIKGDDF